jgi:hypothetical protein
VTGSIGQSLPALAQVLTGTFTPGTDTGLISQSLGVLTQSGTATFAPGTSTASSTQTLPSVTQSATGLVHDIGVITQTLPAITQAAAGVLVVALPISEIRVHLQRTNELIWAVPEEQELITRKGKIL